MSSPSPSHQARFATANTRSMATAISHTGIYRILGSQWFTKRSVSLSENKEPNHTYSVKMRVIPSNSVLFHGIRQYFAITNTNYPSQQNTNK